MTRTEFRLAAHLARALAPARADHVVVPNGDDAAVLRLSGDLVATVDALVQGEDFADAWPWDAVGHKALAQNLSDLAAMGAAPVGYLLAACAPHAFPDDAWDAIASGMAALAHQHGTGCVGGDLSRTEGPLVLSITALGQVPPGAALQRSGARPGDDIWLSGALGGSAAGVRLLLAGNAQPQAGTAQHAAALAQLRPVPRVALGVALRGVATACIDVSDGLVQDLCHVLVASGVGAWLDPLALPFHPGTAWLPPADALHAALAGGEDFELLFTAPPSAASQVEHAAQETHTPCTRVGRITRETALSLGTDTVLRDDVEALHWGQLPSSDTARRWRGFVHGT